MARKVAVVDCRLAGISGNKFIGALLHLGANQRKVVDAMEGVRDQLKWCRLLTVRVSKVAEHGFSGLRVDVETEEDVRSRTGETIMHAVAESTDRLGVSNNARNFAIKTVDDLVRAEAVVHSKEPRHVELHEAGSADTVADVVGAAVALDDLEMFHDTDVYATPVAVGGGVFEFSHGVVTSPAPATMEILRSKGFSLVGGPVEAELTTPTGAALLTNFARQASKFYPLFRPQRVGYGAGAKKLNGVANILRIILGEAIQEELIDENMIIVETNVDDTTGEVVGHVVEKLLQQGARDVSLVPIFTKKSRPGHLIRVISDEHDAANLAKILIEETGTLGVRMIPCIRHISAREVSTVSLDIYGSLRQVRVKIARDLAGKILRLKPEYDDVAKLSRDTGKPLREVMERVLEEAKKLYPN